MKNLNLSDKSSTAEIARFLEPAKNDSELKNLIAKVRIQGKRVLGDGFNIFLDETIVTKNFRNRVFIRLT